MSLAFSFFNDASSSRSLSSSALGRALLALAGQQPGPPFAGHRLSGASTITFGVRARADRRSALGMPCKAAALRSASLARGSGDASFVFRSALSAARSGEAAFGV